LDTVTKIREGVTLRSLEQKSPLHIYVEEADKHFENMRVAIARNSVISLHRNYIPEVNKKLINTFIMTIPGLIKDEVANSLMDKETNNNINLESIIQSNVKVSEEKNGSKK